ncbi:hypothetical protein O181_078131 [Austropuccinia psidii MF-1]|uniref:DUF4939 domain-containing protein n=1 Tax=Austropuccinia psidii MF-1 TaxID=1389203 RepID=A0A9Q3FJE8_9BASI|nr:hypothetical protein [Austropuccinia psidii MF-1]
MQQMIQILASLQENLSSKASKPPAFKTPFQKEPELSYGTQPFKVKRLTGSCQLIFHIDKANFSEDKKKIVYYTSFLIRRAEKWIENYHLNLINQDPNYRIHKWELHESHLFDLFMT